MKFAVLFIKKSTAPIMKVAYYFDKVLAFGTKNRYLSLDNFTPVVTEEQKIIIFGDGTSTTFKAKTSSFFTEDGESATYIVITDENGNQTRWFVAYWEYLNGKQVQVYIRRDIIGDYGISNIYGEINRGYLEDGNKLKYRQELTLNQVLKDRISLIPSSNTYGFVTVDNHNNELWGILYFINSTTEDSYKVNIPAFSPTGENDEYLLDNGEYIYLTNSDFTTVNELTEIDFRVYVHYVYTVGTNENYYYEYIFKLFPANIEKSSFSTNSGSSSYETRSNLSFTIRINRNTPEDGEFNIVPNFILDTLKNRYGNNPLIFLSDLFDDNKETYFSCGYKNYSNIIDYNATVLNGNTYAYNNGMYTEYYTYSINQEDHLETALSLSNKGIVTYYFEMVYADILTPAGIQSCLDNTTSFVFNGAILDSVERDKIYALYTTYSVIKNYIEDSNSGIIEIASNKELYFEPFQILVCPLYNVNLTYTETGEVYNINSQQAFNIFNTVISSLSGENAYILDAQLYPYCPILGTKATELDTDNFKFPFFNVQSQSYTYDIQTTLPVYNDIKQEYDAHNYRMVAPDQSGTYDFKYYDYKNKNEDDNGTITVRIKTCLKPYTMVTTAIIVPDDNCLKGITYESDLRGSSATGKGFEATMTSNAFETYARQNSNYQEIYELSKEELTLNQNIERENEITNGIVNTISAASYGATTGESMGVGKISSAIGATAGAAVMGGLVAGASVAQYQANEEMREFEQKQLDLTYNYNLQTIKNLPDSLNQVSSFNDILLRDFWYIIEVYQCTDNEFNIISDYYYLYSYQLDICGKIEDYVNLDDGDFIKGTVIQCSLPVQYSNTLNEDLQMGVYIYGE